MRKVATTIILSLLLSIKLVSNFISTNLVVGNGDVSFTWCKEGNHVGETNEKGQAHGYGVFSNSTNTFGPLLVQSAKEA